MSVLELVACGSPLAPALVLALTLYAPWHSRLMPTLQLALAAATAALVVAVPDPIAEALASAAFALALAGLAAIALRDRWIARRVRALLDWEQFEQAFASYVALSTDPDRDDPHHHRGGQTKGPSS